MTISTFLPGRSRIHLSFALLSCLLFIGTDIFAQNIFSGEPVQWAGRPNGYSTTPYNSDYRTLGYRKISTTVANPSDGRGQWATTINVQPSGGDIAPDNMPGGGDAGWLLISGPPGSRFQNKWNFNGIGQAGINAINDIIKQSGGNDMGLDMSTAGYYTFVMRDAGYTNTEVYIAYTAAAPVSLVHSGQAFTAGFASTISFQTSATPSAGENLYVRYRVGTNDFTAGTTIVQATGSGTSWIAAIPSQACGATVYYYIFSSTRTSSQLSSATEGQRSLSAIRYDDSFGANFSYSVPNTPASAGVVSGTSPLCIGVSTTYTSTGTSGGTWSSTNAGVATVDPATGVVNAVGAGTSDITYTVVGCNGTVSSFQALTVSPNANAGTVSGITPLTAGATATYTSTGDAGGAWSSTNTNVATVDPNSGVVTAVSAGTSDITYTVSMGCNPPSSAFQALTVNAASNAGIVSGATPLCIGATATYSSTGDPNGTWSSTNTAVATVDPTSGLVTAVGAGTTNITYTIPGPVSSFQPLTVNPNASAGTVSGTSPLCIGTTATYTSTGDAGGTWSSNDPSVATVDANTGVVTAIASGSTAINYTVNSGCTAPLTASQNVVVNPNVNAGVVSGPSTLCIGATDSYSSNGDAGGTWSSSNTAVATVNANGAVSAIAGGTTNISYTISTGCASPQTASISVTVQAIDYANLQFPSSGTICANGSLTAYGQVYEGGVTEAAGASSSIVVEFGYNTANTNPATWPAGNWSAATYNVQAGNNDEYQGSIGNGFAAGTYYYTFRYSINGCAFQYGGYSSGGGNFWDGTNHVSGVLTVNAAYTVTASAGSNGSISPNGATSVCAGSDLTFTITPAFCYSIADVLVDGVSVGVVPSYSFINIQSNHTISATFSANAPAATPTVTGIVNVCPYIGTGEEITYTATSAGATSFQWILPPNVTVVGPSNQGTITLTFQNGFATQANKQLRVRGLSVCGNSAQTIYYLLAQLPGTPQPITGPTNVCPIIGTANTYTYSIPAVAGATGYVWTAQAGTTVVTNNGTSATVQFLNGFTTSAITVRATNGCGTSPARSLTVSRVNPSTPGLISGPTNVCANIAPGGTPATYSVDPVTGATSYTWTIPAGSTSITGQGTNSISFTYPAGYTGGTISVSATNGCGSSAARNLNVTKLNPAAPSAIDVIQTATCPNRVYTYSVAGLPSNATSVQWTVPTGGTITAGQGTSSITVEYTITAIDGNVTAQAVNNCGTSAIRSVQVRLAACGGPADPRMFSKGGQLTTGAENLAVQVSPNPTTSEFQVRVSAAGTERITVRILDMQGRTYKMFSTAANQPVRIGAELKAGAYILEVRQGNETRTEKLLKF